MDTGISREQVETRLHELGDVQDEINRLTRILEVWDEPKKSGRPRGTTATARAARGSRPQEFMDAVKHNPGITASELAAHMDANPNYIYRLASEQMKDGKVIKRGKGYYTPDADPGPDAEAEEADEEVGAAVE